MKIFKRSIDLREQAEIKAYLENTLLAHSQITLRELLLYRPITNGLSELFFYFILAGNSKKHIINNDIQENITLKKGNEIGMEVQIPQVIFRQ
jgi:hypothetical protein